MPQYEVEKSIEVEAPPDKVWEELIDVKKWPEWKSFVPKTRVCEGYECVTTGAKIKMSLEVGGPASVPLSVRITEFKRPGLLAWEGGLKGVFHAVHSFELKDLSGKTRLTSKEVFTGALLPLVRLIVTEQDLEELHEKWVKAVKKRVEGGEEGPEPVAAH